MPNHTEEELKLVFTQIDASAPGREFAVEVRVKEEAYESTACSPPLAAGELEGMVSELNADKNFSAFVRNVRKAFRKLAEEGR